MTKLEFLFRLEQGLAGLPKDDIKERINFYGEMIDDRIEEGLSEEDAVSEVGEADEIISQIINDTPLTKIVKEKIKPKRRPSALEIVLLILGSPIWLSLLIAFFAVILSLYASLWSIIISLWAVFASFAGCALGAVISGAIFACFGNGLIGVATVGAGIVLFGLSVLLFFGCKAATKGIILLTKAMLLGIKKCFVKKGDAK